MLKLLNWPRKKIRQLYGWTVKWAQTKNAEKALGGISFAESSFFPIPPDPLLIAMVFTTPKKWVRYALVAMLASVIGGLFGYLIGWGLFESLGQWLINTYHIETEYQQLGDAIQANGLLAVFAAALTPIPYKIFTITAGAFGLNLFVFVIASILGRSLRFFAVAGLANILGSKYKDQIERYIDVISFIILGVIILIVVLVANG